MSIIRLLLIVPIVLILTGTVSMIASGQDIESPEPTPIQISDSVIHPIEASEALSWTFEGSAGQTLAISAGRYPPDPDSQIDLALELYAPSGDLMAQDDNSGPGRDAMLLNWMLSDDGTYTIVVRNLSDWATGSFELALAESFYPEGCLSPMGTMIESEMPGQVVGWPVKYRIFLPPCYETTRLRYPYVILMHGSNSDDSLWDRLGIDEALAKNMALGRMPPTAIVMPFGAEMANTNIFLIGKSWEYVIVDEMLPYMETNYCLQNTRQARAIGGISRGGFWAFLIAFRHPELFSRLGGHSPYFDLYNAPASHNPLDLALADPPDPPLRIWMDRGKNDYAQLNIDLMHDRLIENNIDHTFHLYDKGRHENEYWSAHVEDYLQFYTASELHIESFPECDIVTTANPG